MGQGQRNKLRRAQAAKDVEYRRQVGVADGGKLPSVIGQAHSAGAAKGGKPGARPRRRRGLGGKGQDRGSVPDIKLTAAQVRTVKCPRCRAAVDAPCRNEYGQPVSAGHADRRRSAQRRIGQEQRGKRAATDQQPKRTLRVDAEISREELTERQAIAQRTQEARQPRIEETRAVYSVEAATSRVTRHRLRVDNGT